MSSSELTTETAELDMSSLSEERRKQIKAEIKIAYEAGMSSDTSVDAVVTPDDRITIIESEIQERARAEVGKINALKDSDILRLTLYEKGENEIHMEGSDSAAYLYAVTEALRLCKVSRPEETALDIVKHELGHRDHFFRFFGVKRVVFGFRFVRIAGRSALQCISIPIGQMTAKVYREMMKEEDIDDMSALDYIMTGRM